MKLKATLILITCLTFSTASYSQCKTFAKNACMPKILPFIHNGQLNTTTLMAGEKAELQMTFYSGQEYRLMICAQPILGSVTFKISDINKKVLYDSKDNNNATLWDFKVASTQQLFVEIDVPPANAPNNIVPSGCVSVLVGFKQ